MNVFLPEFNNFILFLLKDEKNSLKNIFEHNTYISILSITKKAVQFSIHTSIKELTVYLNITGLHMRTYYIYMYNLGKIFQ